jgi:redox-sensitive bicupin YhaK (pirin superfamily)
MIQVRRRSEIFRAEGGWFTGYWHFSFDQYYDPENMGFGTLRVFNVDTLQPGAVWPLHPHRDNEVVTYCVEGEFRHEDNLGNDGVLRPGDVQHTTIGRGMWHSEINNRPDAPMTFVQIWIRPAVLGLPPSVEQKHVRPEERLNRFLPLVSNRHPDALPIRQDSEVYAADVEPGVELSLPLEGGYGAYFYVVRGRVSIDGQEMREGDAAKVRDVRALRVMGLERSEVLTVVVRV